MSGAIPEPVRCAVVGYGEMGRLHAACVGASPLAQPAAVCDPSPAARAAAARAGLPAFASLGEALERAAPLHAAIVATPPDRHLAPVREALAAGLDVLCEKPLAATREDADALVAAAAAAPARLVVGHLRRFDPRFLALRAAIDDGRIGRPRELLGSIACPRADARRLAGAVTLALELSVHDVDAMHWLCGRRIARVHAEALDASETPGPDALVATLRFDDGSVGALHHAWTLPDDAGIDWEFRFRVAGDGGVGEIDGRDRGVTVHSAVAGAAVHPDGFSWPLDAAGRVGGALRAEVDRFLEGVRADAPWPVTLAQARDAVLVALALERSSSTGKPVELDA